MLLDGRVLDADLDATGAPGGFSLLLNGASRALGARRLGPGEWRVALGGRGFRAEVLEERTARLRELAGGGRRRAGIAALAAPMPGLVVRVEAEEGEMVEEGATLVIVEAMKMENELRAAGRARVARVLARPGQAVEKGQVLVEFEEPAQR